MRVVGSGGETFFFQAEDGIRNSPVTGVQTCALPICDEKSTLHNLADKYGVSAERIRQLEKNAMNKIKVHMEA